MPSARMRSVIYVWGDSVPRAVYCEDGSLETFTLLVAVLNVEVWCLGSWVEGIPARAFQALRLFPLHIIAMKMQGHNTITEPDPTNLD